MVLPTWLQFWKLFAVFVYCFATKALGSFLAMAKGLLTAKAGHMDEEELQTFTCLG